MIRHSAAVALGALLKLYFLQDAIVLSTVEMLHDIAMYKFDVDRYWENFFKQSANASVRSTVLFDLRMYV